MNRRSKRSSRPLKAVAAHASVALALSVAASSARAAHNEFLAGYLILPTAEHVDKSFNAGFSLYVAAWPLLGTYPGHQFQTGLPGTWMFAQYDGKAPEHMYSDVEGGLGWWRDTRFPTTTPKFIMGGVGPNFSVIANGPAHGWGTWEEPRGLYGVAQLSPWVLFPLDGLNLKQGVAGELFGYGYLNLPLTDAKPTTDGKNIPTGGNCWTLFINANNFKGPLAFFLPYFWSHATALEPRLAGLLLDSRPMDPNMSLQMETQYIPCRIAVNSTGEAYARIQPVSFPRDTQGDSVLLHQCTAYNKTALWDSVKAWFNGGAASKGAIDPNGAFIRTFKGEGYATWQINFDGDGKTQKQVPIAWDTFATPKAADAHTYGYSWNRANTIKTSMKNGNLVTLPEYYRLENGADKEKARWVPVDAATVPDATGLKSIKWARPVEPPQEPYTTPSGAKSAWKKPGPVAGPFQARLGDGSVVTYYWYRFADQPALLNADLTDAERERMQAKVELLHRNWPKNGAYLAEPKTGKLADIDPAQLVKPPKGFEYGYVPIATKQELKN